jgi:hypothetical protein
MNAHDDIPNRRRDIFVGTGAVLFGADWQRAIARTLGRWHPQGARDAIDDRLVRRWATGERPVPHWVFPALAEVVDVRARGLNAFLIRLRQEANSPTIPARLVADIRELRALIRGVSKTDLGKCWHQAADLVTRILSSVEQNGAIAVAARRVLDQTAKLFNSIRTGSLDEHCRHDALDAIDRLQSAIRNAEPSPTCDDSRDSLDQLALKTTGRDG